MQWLLPTAAVGWRRPGTLTPISTVFCNSQSRRCCRGPGAALGYRANLWLRSAVRVLQLVSEGDLDPDKPGGEVPILRVSWL